MSAVKNMPTLPQSAKLTAPSGKEPQDREFLCLPLRGEGDRLRRKECPFGFTNAKIGVLPLSWLPYTNLKLKGKRGFLKETQSSKLLGKNFNNFHWCSAPLNV